MRREDHKGMHATATILVLGIFQIFEEKVFLWIGRDCYVSFMMVCVRKSSVLI